MNEKEHEADNIFQLHYIHKLHSYPRKSNNNLTPYRIIVTYCLASEIHLANINKRTFREGTILTDENFTLEAKQTYSETLSGKKSRGQF